MFLFFYYQIPIVIIILILACVVYFVLQSNKKDALTDNQKIIGAPKDFPIHIRDIRVSTGAKFIICLTGEVMTMPGLSKEPMALKIDIDENYNVYGLM